MKSSKLFIRIVAIASIGCCSVGALAQVGTWQFKAHMIVPRNMAAAAPGPDGRIFVFGGEAAFVNAYASAEAYNPSTNSWSAISDMPDARRGMLAVTAPNGFIYLIGGIEADNTGKLSAFKYDPATDTYTSIADAPVAFGAAPGALGNDGRIYVYAASDYQAVYAYDPGQDSWSLIGNTPSTMTVESAVCAGADGLLYRFGGETNAIVKTVDSYNAVTNVWGTPPSFSTARYQEQAAPGGDGNIYLIGGQGSSSPLSSVELFNPKMAAWGSAPDLLESVVMGAAAEGTDGKVYVFGGFAGGGGTSDHVECFQPQLLDIKSIALNMDEGSPFSGTVAFISDVDHSQTVGDFTAKIDWGDGSSIDVADVSDNGNPGEFKVSGNHTYAHFGSFLCKITVHDTDGENESITDVVTVKDATITLQTATISAQSGIAFSGPVGFFSDANPDAQLTDFTATIDWGDSTTTNATLVIDSSGTKFDIDGTHTYSAIGTYSVHITITQSGGGTFLIHEPANVVAPSAVVTAGHITTVEGANFNGQVATFTDPDPNQTAANFTATIDWGDGTTSTGSVTSNGAGGFNVSGNHTYAEEGSYALIVTVAVTGGLNSSSTGSAFATDAPLTATGFDLICKGTNFSNTVAAFTDADLLGTTSDYAASIFWGDGKSSNGTIVAAGSGWKVVGSHAYLKRGKYTVTITIRDVGGATASATTHINAGPVK